MKDWVIKKINLNIKLVWNLAKYKTYFGGRFSCLKREFGKCQADKNFPRQNVQKVLRLEKVLSSSRIFWSLYDVATNLRLIYLKFYIWIFFLKILINNILTSYLRPSIFELPREKDETPTSPWYSSTTPSSAKFQSAYRWNVHRSNSY